MSAWGSQEGAGVGETAARAGRVDSPGRRAVPAVFPSQSPQAPAHTRANRAASAPRGSRRRRSGRAGGCSSASMSSRWAMGERVRRSI